MDIPRSDMLYFDQSKERILHVVVITTLNTFYTIIQMQPRHKSTFGISSSKALAKELFDGINEAKAQVEKSF